MPFCAFCLPLSLSVKGTLCLSLRFILSKDICNIAHRESEGEWEVGGRVDGNHNYPHQRIIFITRIETEWQHLGKTNHHAMFIPNES